MSVLASVWSFILTLVRSLLALFSLRRRRASVDPFSLPSVHRTAGTPSAALARTHSRLRPILLTPRSISLTRTVSILHTDNAVISTNEPERISPKLDPHDPELGLRDGQLTASATRLRECTPDTSATGSLSVLPLTPPDRCYLAPLPSTTDCPYTEPRPIGVPVDRAKSRLSGSPLKMLTNTDPAFPKPMVAPIGSPSPGRWSPIEIWTSTPCKNDTPDALDLAVASFDTHKDASALVNISHAIITRSQSSIQPYDDNSSVSLDVSPSVNLPGPTHERHRTLAHVSRSMHQPYPRFHHPDAYAFAWRRYGARLPGKADRPHGHSRSRSYMDLASNEWYNADAYASSPVALLSPPLGDSATEDEDEDEMPLYRLKERLSNRSAAVGATLGLGLPVGVGTRKPAALSPRSRRMSEGCLLALSQTTPSRVGVNDRSSRRVLSMAVDSDAYTKDWLEALSLQYSPEQTDAPEPGTTESFVDAVAV